ncbi:hypothetical protein CYR55_19760 [Chimaeribacter californicus]|uniref:Fimbrial biogenesis outer membrane usher protein n=1 Tax=Chimaeribacter californicus TaxID=2060067 RepID=A0A2N5DWZ6_9GAMM|nr:fimbria/pilus outer membrane usher protein [Chimaeribacter californicus]PLR31814.1 hypothetical protein CYR55_19760 [Chimaeribacter californicus]
MPLNTFSVRKKIIIALASLAIISFPLRAVEFNLHALDAEARNNIDLAAFSEPGSITAGDYLVTVTVNGQQLPDPVLLTWRATPQATGPQPCIPDFLADALGLQPEIRRALPQAQGCVSFTARPEITFTLDSASQTLAIAVPQAWLAYTDSQGVPRSMWHHGIGGAFLDYTLFAAHYAPQQGEAQTDLSAYGTAGLNLGAWRVRGDLDYFTGDKAESESDVSLSRLYAFRPLPSINSKVTLGETDFHSDIFDSFAFTGVALESDERMLPYTLRGYAPQISGIAKTHARVTLSQNGRTLYQTDVPPGPFVLQDLSEAYQGALEVTVTEEDGSRTRFTVEAATVPFLTRKGQWRYKLSGGRVAGQGSGATRQPDFYSGEFSWGAFNQTSLYGGLLIGGSDYRALSLGAGQNLTHLGAVSFDVTQAQAARPHQAAARGHRYRINYNKRFAASHSELAFSGARYADRRFPALPDLARGGPAGGHEEKQTFSLTANQYITPLALSLALSLRNQRYWQGADEHTYSLTLGRMFDLGPLRSISASLSAGRTHSERGERDKQIYLSFSLPLNDGDRLSYSVQQGDGVDQLLSYAAFPDRDSNWGMSLGHQHGGGREGVLARGNVQQRSALGELAMAGSYKQQAYHSLNASWAGSLTATRHGAALHRYNQGNEPRLMVDGNGVAAIPLNNGSAVTNPFGVAVIPTLSSYQPIEVRVDVNQLPDDVTVHNNVLRQTFTEGAIGYRPLNAVQGGKGVVVIQLADGTFPPLGAEIVDEESARSVGMVSEAGMAYLQGVAPGHALRVQWSGGDPCRLTLPETFATAGEARRLTCRAP